MYSSSVLRYREKHCPHALTLYEQRVPQDRTMLDVGVAAHEVLRFVSDKQPSTDAGLLDLANGVFSELITNGRVFRGHQEPPLVVESARAGRELAVDYVRAAGNPPNGLAERELFIGNTYAGLIDLIYVKWVGDEEDAYPSIVVRDYKSAWPTDESELETTQTRGQVVLVMENLKAVCAELGVAVDETPLSITQEVVNIRTRVPYRREWFIGDEEFNANLQQWELDILAKVKAAESGSRQPAPGVGCLTCPFAHACEHVAKIETSDKAARFVRAKALVTALGKELREETAVNPWPVEGGEVGYQRKDKRIASEEHIDAIMETMWPDEGVEIQPHEVRSVLAALKLGSSSLTEFAKKMYPGREGRASRDDLIERMLTIVGSAEFNIWRQS